MPVFTPADEKLLTAVAKGTSPLLDRPRVMELHRLAVRVGAEAKQLRFCNSALTVAAFGLRTREEIATKPGLPAELLAQCLELRQLYDDAMAWRALRVVAPEDVVNEPNTAL